MFEYKYQIESHRLRKEISLLDHGDTIVKFTYIYFKEAVEEVEVSPIKMRFVLKIEPTIYQIRAYFRCLKTQLQIEARELQRGIVYGPYEICYLGKVNRLKFEKIDQ